MVSVIVHKHLMVYVITIQLIWAKRTTKLSELDCIVDLL